MLYIFEKLCYVTITFYSHLLQMDCYSPLSKVTAVVAYPGFTVRKVSVSYPRLLLGSMDHDLSSVCSIFAFVLEFLLKILNNTNLNTVKEGAEKKHDENLQCQRRLTN